MEIEMTAKGLLSFEDNEPSRCYVCKNHITDSTEVLILAETNGSYQERNLSVVAVHENCREHNWKPVDANGDLLPRTSADGYIMGWDYVCRLTHLSITDETGVEDYRL